MTTGQQLYLLLKELWGFMPSTEMASLRFLGSVAKSGHLWSITFHDGESDGWRIFPSNSPPCACHMRSFTIFEDWNILLNRGISGKYHITLTWTPLLFLVPLLFTFHLEAPHVGREGASFNSFLKSMQSLGSACIFFHIPFPMHSMFFCFIHRQWQLIVERQHITK